MADWQPDDSEPVTNPKHRVEVSSNASGGVSVAVKIYDDNPDVAAQIASRIHDDLRGRYPVKVK